MAGTDYCKSARMESALQCGGTYTAIALQLFEAETGGAAAREHLGPCGSAPSPEPLGPCMMT